MSDESELAEFMKFLASKKFTPKQIKNQKKWFTIQQTMTRNHELKTTMIEWFHKDHQAKYFVGAAVGAGTALAGTVLGEIMAAAADELGLPAAPETTKEAMERLRDVYWEEAFAWLIPGLKTPALVKTALSASGLSSPFSTATDLASAIPDVLKMSGTGFFGLCAAEIILYSIFSGTDLGELIDAVMPG